MQSNQNDLKISNKVFFHFGNKKYLGTLIDHDPKNSQYKVNFISAVKNGRAVYAEEWFNGSELKKYRSRLNTLILPGDIVEFISECDGLKYGVVQNLTTKKGNDYYDICFYSITAQNQLLFKTNLNVHSDRITYISKSENEYKILPVKKGNWVEFRNSITGQRIKGRICDIYGSYTLPLFEIKYYYTTESGFKDHTTDESVSIEDLWLIR